MLIGFTMSAKTVHPLFNVAKIPGRQTMQLIIEPDAFSKGFIASGEGQGANCSGSNGSHIVSLCITQQLLESARSTPTLDYGLTFYLSRNSLDRT